MPSSQKNLKKSQIPCNILPRSVVYMVKPPETWTIRKKLKGNGDSVNVAVWNGGDISGIYEEFKYVHQLGGITLKGADGAYSVAFTVRDCYSISISAEPDLSETGLVTVINSIK